LNPEKQIIEEPGQPPTVNSNFDFLCFMDFKDNPSFIQNQTSPIFSNTKLVQDSKDCGWLVSAWKIGTNGLSLNLKINQ